MATFGEHLRHLIAQRGISGRQLAKRVPVSDGYLSRLARDLKVPSRQVAERLDELLDAGGTLAALRPPDPVPAREERARLAYAVAHPTRLDAGAVETLEIVLAGQRRLEDSIGPAALIGPVAAQLETLTRMLKETSGPQHRPLGRVVAEWSTFTGWLHAALRRDAKAMRLFQLAERQADEFDHGTVAALAISFGGYVARKQGRTPAVIRASAAAMAAPGAHPAQVTFDLLQSARGYAALGETDRARRLLNEAAARADDLAEPPPPIYWYTPSFFRLVTGITFSSLGDHESAAALVAEGKAGLPADQRGAEWVVEFDEILERDLAAAGG